ncbi:hypothetical protein JK358_37470 [Nocardia sp. 2]|uniref:Uncharacterized protein n=1 Tax=Nocardia acididurans TaxID=2802282 RepID=A0ABS1MHK5_9NOCA|nr:hypothetical protein [Nocardia acididurans]MBL1080102.1 hypothetical protein [Nocardia acididurans]
MKPTPAAILAWDLHEARKYLEAAQQAAEVIDTVAQFVASGFAETDGFLESETGDALRRRAQEWIADNNSRHLREAAFYGARLEGFDAAVQIVQVVHRAAQDYNRAHGFTGPQLFIGEDGVVTSDPPASDSFIYRHLIYSPAQRAINDLNETLAPALTTILDEERLSEARRTSAEAHSGTGTVRS